MRTEVTVYNRTTPIFTMSVDEKDNVVEVHKVLNRKLLPICLQGNFTGEEVIRWFDKREIPKQREGLDQAELLFPGMTRKHNRFSLSDQYWVQYDKKETYEKLNYFTNRYLADTGNAFFTPWNVNQHNISTESPDLTTSGNVRKRWIQDKVKDEKGEYPSYLIKSGSKKYHQTPLTEILSSITMKKLRLLPFVEYQACIEGVEVCSKCKNFVTSETELVPASHISRKEPWNKNEESEYDHMVHMCNKYGIPGIEEFLDRMITADYFTRNTDRHAANYGFIRSAITGDILGFAPLFDLGSSFTESKNKVPSQSLHFAEREKLLADIYIKDNPGIVKELKEDDLLMAVESFPTISEEEKDSIKERIVSFYDQLGEQVNALHPQ